MKEQIKMKKQYALEHLNGNPSKSELSYIPNFKNEANISFETLKGNLQLNVFANSETGNELLKATLNDIDSNNNSLENVRKIIDNIGLTSKEQEREVINLYTNLLHFNGLDKEIYSRNSEILKNFSNYYEYSGVGLIEAWNNNTFDKSFFILF